MITTKTKENREKLAHWLTDSAPVEAVAIEIRKEGQYAGCYAIDAAVVDPLAHAFGISVNKLRQFAFDHADKKGAEMSAMELLVAYIASLSERKEKS